MKPTPGASVRLGRRRRLVGAGLLLVATTAATAGCSDDVGPQREGSPSSASDETPGDDTTRTTAADPCVGAFEAAKVDGKLPDNADAYLNTLEVCETVARWKAGAAAAGSEIVTNENSDQDAANILDFSVCIDATADATPVCADAASMTDAAGAAETTIVGRDGT